MDLLIPLNLAALDLAVCRGIFGLPRKIYPFEHVQDER